MSTEPPPVFSQERIESLLSHIINALRARDGLVCTCLYEHRDALRPHLTTLAQPLNTNTEHAIVAAYHAINAIMCERSQE